MSALHHDDFHSTLCSQCKLDVGRMKVKQQLLSDGTWRLNVAPRGSMAITAKQQCLQRARELLEMLPDNWSSMALGAEPHNV